MRTTSLLVALTVAGCGGGSTPELREAPPSEASREALVEAEVGQQLTSRCDAKPGCARIHAVYTPDCQPNPTPNEFACVVHFRSDNVPEGRVLTSTYTARLFPDTGRVVVEVDE